MIRRRMKPLDSWDSDRRNVSFVRFLAEGLTITKAVELVGIQTRTMEKRRKRLKAFDDAVREALEKGSEERKYRAWLHHPFRGKRPPTGKGHGGKPRFAYGRRG